MLLNNAIVEIQMHQFIHKPIKMVNFTTISWSCDKIPLLCVYLSFFDCSHFPRVFEESFYYSAKLIHTDAARKRH